MDTLIDGYFCITCPSLSLMTNVVSNDNGMNRRGKTIEMLVILTPALQSTGESQGPALGPKIAFLFYTFYTSLCKQGIPNKQALIIIASHSDRNATEHQAQGKSTSEG